MKRVVAANARGWSRLCANAKKLRYSFHGSERECPRRWRGSAGEGQAEHVGRTKNLSNRRAVETSKERLAGRGGG